MDIKLENVANNSTSYQSYKGNNYVEQEMKVETDELEIKREVEDDSYNFEQRNDDSFTAVFVKNECKIEEETSFTYEDAKSEESCDYNIKKEDMKYSTATENEEIGQFSEDSYNILSQDIKDDIDIKEHSPEIKEEYTTKTPDGSTSQRVESINEILNDIKRLKARNAVLTQSDKPFECEICDKRGLLKDHMRCHLEKRTFQNETDQEMFDSKDDPMIQSSEINFNPLTHSGERLYACELCNKTLKSQINLKKHYKTHSNKRQYKCDVCFKTFNDNGYLKVHMRIHSGEKPYECDICGKRFIQKTSCDAHRHIHFNERPFKCEICKQTFTTNSDLSQHFATHSNDKLYECRICDKSFLKKSYLTQHLHSRTHSTKVKDDSVT